MRCRRLVLTLMMLALCASELQAQFYPGPVFVPGVPVLVPNGFGFQHRGRRLSVSGFFNTGYSVGVVPARGFFPGPVVPVYSVPTVGFIESRVTYQVIAPTVVLAPRRGLGLAPEDVDLSGVDLDVELSPLLAGRAKPPPREFRPRLEAPVEGAAIVKEKPERPKVDLPKPVKPVEDVPTSLEQGRGAFREGEFGLAALHFRQAAAAEPTSGRPLFLLAQAYFAQGKFRDAVSTIQDGLKTEPDFPLQPFRPQIELFKGFEEEYARQRKTLDDLMLEHAKNGTFLFLHGYLDWFDGNRAAARKTFARARDLLPDTWVVDRFLKAPEELVREK